MSAFGDIALDTAEGAATGSVVPGWGTLIGAGLGLAKGIYGAIESGKAPKRPQISVNPYTQMALDLAKQQFANKGLPGQDILENKLDQTTSNYVNDAKKSNNSMDFITGLASAMANKYAQQNNIAVEGANSDRLASENLQKALANSAEDQDRMQQWNVEGGYQDQLARKQAQTTGISNLIGDIGSVGNAYLTGAAKSDFVNQLYGLGKYSRMPQIENVTPKLNLPTISPSYPTVLPSYTP